MIRRGAQVRPLLLEREHSLATERLSPGCSVAATLWGAVTHDNVEHQGRSTRKTRTAVMVVELLAIGGVEAAYGSGRQSTLASNASLTRIVDSHHRQRVRVASFRNHYKQCPDPRAAAVINCPLAI